MSTPELGPGARRAILGEYVPSLEATGKQIVREVVAGARRLGLSVALRPGTVTTPGTDGSVRVIVDGDTTGMRVVSLIGPALQTGTRVMVLISHPAGNHIIGYLGSPPDGAGVVLGVRHTTGAAVGTTTETATPAFDLNLATASKRLFAGRIYRLTGAYQMRSTVAGDVGDIRWRLTTAVTGTLVDTWRHLALTTTQELRHFEIIMRPTADITANLKASIFRAGGTGTVTLSTGPAGVTITYIYVEDLSSTQMWTNR